MFPVFLFFLSLSVSGQDWETDFAKAISRVEETGKPMVLVFSGSDWCAPCIRLDREIWQSEAFKAYAKDHYVLYRADFPRKKSSQLPSEKMAENNQLAQKFNPKGHFPLVVVLDGKEQVLGTLAYQKVPPEDYISQLNSFLK